MEPKGKVKRFRGIPNEPFQRNWVQEQLCKIRQQEIGDLKCLDVGAGQSPFRDFILALGIDYLSNDFNGYVPSEGEIGQQNKSWDYFNHTYICDVLDIRENVKFDIILCTEVLEHVPDPVAVFKKLRSLCLPGGYLIITVPLHSLIHQAPYYFSAGLSPYWFQFHADLVEVEVLDLAIYGDYSDFLQQELQRAFEHYPIPSALKSKLQNAFSIVNKRLGDKLSLRLPETVLDSGGFGTVFVGRLNGK
jgi:SAM-dependent methyltransferase